MSHMADVVYLRSYDDRGRDDEETRKVLGATVELLREVAYADLTMRAIGKRAGVGVGRSGRTSGPRTPSSPRSISTDCVPCHLMSTSN